MTAPRDLVKPLVGEKPRRIYGFCAYCGAPCHGHTCRGHADLARIEHEHYLKSNATTRTPSTDARAVASTKGA